MNIEEGVGKIEEAVLIMKELLVSHNTRLDDYFTSSQETKNDFDFKFNALVDAQIRNESEILELRQSGEVLKDAIKELKELSQSTLERLSRLENGDGNK